MSTRSGIGTEQPDGKPSEATMNELYIPENELGIAAGYYDTNAIVALLREHGHNLEIVYFIADMMEV